MTKSKLGELSSKDQCLFYDPQLFSEMKSEFFEGTYWQQQGQITGSSVGRGTTWFFSHQQHEFVLRHYLRGGLIAKFNREHYLFTSKQATRSWQEFHLLQQLRQLGLPVPRPAAGRIQRKGLFYKADLIIELIPNSQDLVHILREKEIDNRQWQDIGRLIAQFHQAGVEHADLNAHNILIDANNKVWLIDFDRGQIHQNKSKQGKWQQGNLQRLQRSFIKEAGKNPVFHWQENHWQALMQGYQSELN